MLNLFNDVPLVKDDDYMKYLIEAESAEKNS
jgi:hypothetical protein